MEEPRRNPEELENALEELRKAISETGVSADHLAPDLVATGLARDVYENASAALLISKSNISRPLYPNARSAFEAAQDMALLVTDEDYDEAGARAIVAEILDREASRELAKEVLKALDQSDEIIPQDVEESVEETAAFWDRFAPGKGDLVREALPKLRKLRKSGKYHWSGLSRSRIHQVLEDRIGGKGGTREIYRSLYNLLSFESHPSPRIDTKHMTFDPEKGFTLFLEPDTTPEEGMGIAAALIAVETAKVVLSDVTAKRD